MRWKLSDEKASKYFTPEGDVSKIRLRQATAEPLAADVSDGADTHSEFARSIQAADELPQNEPAPAIGHVAPEAPGSNFAKLVNAWQACTPEEQRRLLNQNNAIILSGGEGLLLIRGFHAAALRDSDRQTRIREFRALLTAFDLTARDLFLPADAPASSTPDKLTALRAALAAKLSECDYDLVNTLWALHNLNLLGAIAEKNLPALIEAKPPFDYLGLLYLGRAIMDLSHVWEARERRKPAQNDAAPPVNDPGPMPDFLRRTPTGANGKAAS
jgi:hypothetical protein